MGYLPYDVNLKTIFWVFVLIYLGLIIIFFVRKSLQTEIKTQKSVFCALAIFFSLYIITRIFFIIYDYERDLNGNTLAAFRYLAIAYAFFILAFLDFIYLTEKYVINRSKYIITYIFLIAFIINVIMIFFPELMPLIRYINYGLLYSEAAIILIIYLVIDASKKRTVAFLKNARRLGYSFMKDMKIPDNYLKFFKKGVIRKAKNFVIANKNGKILHIFDYYYKESGKYGEMGNQTVALTDLKSTDFELYPETFMDRLSDRFTKKDIDFENKPEFSKKYVLKGSDKLKINDLFDGSVLQFFENKKEKYHIESDAGKIVIYRKNFKIKPKNLHNFIEDVSRIINLLKRE